MFANLGAERRAVDARVAEKNVDLPQVDGNCT